MMRLLLSIVAFDRATGVESPAHFHVSLWLTCRTARTCCCDFVSPQHIFDLPLGGSTTMKVIKKWSKKKYIIWLWWNLSMLDIETVLTVINTTTFGSVVLLVWRMPVGLFPTQSVFPPSSWRCVFISWISLTLRRLSLYHICHFLWLWSITP